MNDNPRANGSRGRDPYAALRLIALIAAIVGVIVLAAAAFVLSYGGIHKIALSAGVSPNVARIFPVIFDAMLVVSCAAVVSLRSAGWWPRTYSWLSTLALLVVVAAADAAHATGTHIPRKPAAATVAVLPWALLLLAFSLLLSMLRQFRRTRAAAAAAGTPRVTGRGAAPAGQNLVAVPPPPVAHRNRPPGRAARAGHPEPAGPGPAACRGRDHDPAQRDAPGPHGRRLRPGPGNGRQLRPGPGQYPAREPRPAETLPAETPDSVSPAGPTSQNIQTRRTDADQQPQRNPSQPAPPPATAAGRTARATGRARRSGRRRRAG